MLQVDPDSFKSMGHMEVSLRYFHCRTAGERARSGAKNTWCAAAAQLAFSNSMGWSPAGCPLLCHPLVPSAFLCFVSTRPLICLDPPSTAHKLSAQPARLSACAAARQVPRCAGRGVSGSHCAGSRAGRGAAQGQQPLPGGLSALPLPPNQPPVAHAARRLPSADGRGTVTRRPAAATKWNVRLTVNCRVLLPTDRASERE